MTKALLCILSTLSLAAIAVGCDPSSSHNDDHATVKRVDVKNPRPEADLTTVTLSDEARKHLAIRTIEVVRESAQQFRTYGGTTVIPEGRSITLSSPLPGTITATSSRTWPGSGISVSVGEILFELLPSIRGDREVLNPADRIALARAQADLESARAQARGEVEAALVRLDAAAIALERAERLLKENAGSVRSLDEAKAGHRLAQSNLDAAQTRLSVLERTFSDLEGAATGAALPISPQFDGVLQKIYVAAGEAVAAGAPLCEIASLNPLWIKVPVYVGDAASLERVGAARVFLLGDSRNYTLRAKPVSSPMTANPSTATVDWYYEIENPTLSLFPGQRLRVDIPATARTDVLVIPWASVVHDIHGGQWVYREVEPGAYTRLRVAVDRVDGDHAVLADGLQEKSRIVVEGSAELFGIEFGGAGH
ncbi:hypothetical protein B7486_14430 [cyanobacterium TDX16]|nr:hypothetical protein B7486_14430 [cyanobacterium TDX16]